MTKKKKFSHSFCFWSFYFSKNISGTERLLQQHLKPKPIIFNSLQKSIRCTKYKLCSLRRVVQAIDITFPITELRFYFATVFQWVNFQSLHNKQIDWNRQIRVTSENVEFFFYWNVEWLSKSIHFSLYHHIMKDTSASP